ncbi:MAG: hypothetical protein JKY27_13625 [Magnetovibrio sp.]|nr:hypothetical protein [Magnetovibrio sp.]
MQTVQPPPPPPTTPVSVPANSAIATAVKIPPALSQMTLGQSLAATVPPQPSQALPANQILVQTALGPITLQTAMAIPKGAALTLTLTTLSPQPAFLISELNGKPVQAAQIALKNGPNGLQAAKPQAPLPLSQGTRVTATLVRPAVLTTPAAVPASTPPQAAVPASSQAPVATTPQAAPQVQPGPAVQAATVSTPAPSTAPSATTPQTSTTTAQPTAQPPTTSAPQTSNTPRQITLPTGTRFTLSIVRINAPSAALSTPTPPTSGGLIQGTTLTGTITGTTPQGQPIVQTPHSTFALNAQSALSIGTQVVFKLETAPLLPTPQLGAKLGQTGPADTLVQARAWSDLDDGLKALAQIDPSRFQQVAQNAIPQPGAKLTSQMLFFLNALKGGDFSAWLGENATRLIDRERPGLMKRLSGDFSIMSKMADEPQSGDWKLALVPLWGGGEVEQVRMYYRGGDEAQDEEGDDDGVRFILDLTLSNIGHVQIDGLAKAEQHKLDLIIRTQVPLPDQWRTEIGTIFMAAQELAGLGGGVAFQAAPGNFTEFPPIDPSAPHPGLYA